MATGTPTLRALVDAIVANDVDEVTDLLTSAPELASEQADRGATRTDAVDSYYDDIGHYLYAGDTALHMAAAAHRPETIWLLLANGGDVDARNRRGAQPLHYAADGSPGTPIWRPDDQAAAVERLIAAGADPNALDKSGVAPLHRAVRTRSTPAVRALLAGGANPRLRNKSGSTPMKLAAATTGRGGSGSAAAKEEQEAIIRLLEDHLAG